MLVRTHTSDRNVKWTGSNRTQTLMDLHNIEITNLTFKYENRTESSWPESLPLWLVNTLISNFLNRIEILSPRNLGSECLVSENDMPSYVFEKLCESIATSEHCFRIVSTPKHRDLPRIVGNLLFSRVWVCWCAPRGRGYFVFDYFLSQTHWSRSYRPSS